MPRRLPSFRSRRITGFILALAWGLLGAAGPQSCAPPGTLYGLLPASTFVRGCFGPCLCAVELGKTLGGSFLLVQQATPPASPFREFQVNAVQWWVELGGQTVPITGSGSYRVGGEVAVSQELTLDLQVGNGPVQHFDSGLVAGGGSFPAIDVQTSVVGAVCYNTVIHVVAQPFQ